MKVKGFFIFWSCLISISSGKEFNCDATISVGIFAENELLKKLDSLNLDFLNVVKVLITNIQQQFLPERFGGKGVNIEVVVASEVPKEVTGTDNAKEYLKNFCEAIASLKTYESLDLAILLSARDLYVDEKNKTGEDGRNMEVRGISYKGSVCKSSEKKCIVLEANELNTAVIAGLHEMGHYFGLSHDEETQCISNPGFMTSSLEMKDIKTSFQWSSCSLEKITAEFEMKTCSCLMKDGNGNDLLKDKEFKTISGNQQCNLAYGKTYEMFSGVLNDTQVDVCKGLYCVDKDTNVVKFQPGAPSLGGTECENGGKCWNGACIQLKDFDPETKCKKSGDKDNGQSEVQKLVSSIVKNVIQIFKDFMALFKIKL